jgi:hypothetical protein
MIPEPKGNSHGTCSCPKVNKALKNKHNSKKPGYWIDSAEIDDMVKNTVPEPEDGQNSYYKSVITLIVPNTIYQRNRPKEIGEHLSGPNRGIEPREDFKKLLNGKWDIHILIQKV